MSEDNFIELDNGYGFCPMCGSALVNFGAASRGDGDIFDEIRCPQEYCSYEGWDEHADYCQCPDCNP